MNYDALNPAIFAAMMFLSMALLVRSRRPALGANIFVIFMLTLTVWTLGQAVSSFELYQNLSPLFQKIGFVGASLAPSICFLIILQYAGLEDRIKGWLFIILMLEPLVFNAFVWTNSGHFLVWLPESSVSRPVYGIVFWVHSIYSLLLVFTASGLLVRSILRSPKLMRIQIVVLFVAILAPWIANILHLLGVLHFNQFDFTPLAFAISSPLLAWGFFHSQPVDWVPVSYNSVIGNMEEGVAILDTKFRIWSINRPASRLAGIKEQQAIGQPVNAVYHFWSDVFDDFHENTDGRLFYQIGDGRDAHYYEFRLSPLYDNRKKLSGWMFVSNDISAHKRSEAVLQRRAEETAALHATLIDLTSSQDFGELLRSIVERAARLLGADGGSLYLSDSKTARVLCVVSYNRSDDIVGKSLRYWEGAAGTVAASGKPLIVNDYLDWPNSMDKIDNEAFIEALLSAPMIWQGQVTGVINVFHFSSKQTFTNEDMELLTVFANQAAIVVENARLIQSEREQRKQAETLREVTSILNNSLDRRQILQMILEQLARVVDYDSASVMLINDGLLSVVAQRKFQATEQNFKDLEISSLPHVQDALNKRHPVIISDTKSDHRWKTIPRAKYIRCWLGVPLKGRDRIIGLLNLDKEEPDFYKKQHADLAEAFANQAAIAIENARLFEAAQHRAQEAETLRQAASAIVSTLNQEEALQRILVQLARVVPFDTASVQLLRDGYLEIVDGAGWDNPEDILGLRFKFPSDNPNTIVMQQKRPFILADAPAAYPYFNESKKTIRSWMGIPLIIHDKVIGMLALDSFSKNFFNYKHAQLVSALADQVAIALENARLYAFERQRVNESDALRATMADISAELELTNLLQAILERATTLLDGTGGELGLYLKEEKQIEIVASYNMGKDLRGTCFQLGQGPLGKVAATLEPLILEKKKSTTANLHPDGPWHAFVAVPLLTSGRLVGAIGVVDSDTKRRFTSNDQRLLNLFAHQAVIAVENARLYQSLKEAAERREALHMVSQEIVGVSLDPEGIYTAIHQAAAKLMPTEAFVITLYNQEDNMIDAVYLIDRLGRGTFERIPPDRGLSGRVIASGQSLYIGDMMKEIEQVDAVHFGDPNLVRSILAVPMRLGGKVIGMLSAQSYRAYAYTPEDKYLLEMLASYAAIALDNSRLFKEVQRLAITDPLTGIYNRRQLLELGQREFSRSRRFDRPLSVIMLDIDHFKQVNDSYGHAAGDHMLIALTTKLQELIRDVDILGRYGGEEFTILLSETDLAGAEAIAERLREYVENLRGEDEYADVSITVSIGVAEMSDFMEDLLALIDHADKALYEAKSTGRNRVAVC